MATAQLEKVQEFLTCTICADKYTDPCTLNCQHTFCRNCITKYTKTRPEALQSKTIPCPSCRQVTKVPDATKPVDRWAWQIKPSIIILGLIDTSVPDQTTTGRTCNACEQSGETTRARATLWCSECEIALCDRCARMHHVIPALRDHELCDLSAELKVRRKRKVTCQEHKKNCIEFHCNDCKKSACQTCCIIYHRACKDVVTIESMKQEMMSKLNMKRNKLSKTVKMKSRAITSKKTEINKVSKNKMTIQSQIQSVSQKATDKIKLKEKQLMNKLDEVTDKQMSQLQADIKLEEIEVQMYRQHCEFIDQAMNSECVMDMYDVYQVCESEVLMLDDGSKTDTTDRQVIEDIRFTHNMDKVEHEVDKLLLGKIEVTEKTDETCMSLSPVLHDTLDIKTSEDKRIPSAWYVTVLTVNDLRVTVVTDGINMCIKSFYTLNDRSQCSRLPRDDTPWGITQVKENQVLVAVPRSRQIVTVKVTPDLFPLSTIKTNKSYSSLAVLSPSSLVAGCVDYFTNHNGYVDILNMDGQVMKSIPHHNNVKLFSEPYFMCVNKKGNILVSDYGNISVIYLTPDGDVLWQYTPQGNMELKGITTTSEGDILLADSQHKKVIQLNERGEFVRNVLTSADGLTDGNGIVCTESGSLIVCDKTAVKEFKLG